MRTATETRRGAWNRLREGGVYGKFLLGQLCLSVLSGVAMFLVGISFMAGFLALQGILDADTIAAAKDIPLIEILKNHDVDAVRRTVQTLLQHPQLLGWSMVVAIPPVAILFYFIAFGSWGAHAMGIACVRRGLDVTHAFSGWGNGWKMVRLLFCQQTYVFFWLLLFVVPGVRAMFSYALAPYLQIDHPAWSPHRCLKESARLMEGHRWRLFTLGFSFLGWYALAFLVHYFIPFLGGFAQFLLGPYTSTAFALFYEERLDATEAEGRTDECPAQADQTEEDEQKTDEQERNPEDDEH